MIKRIALFISVFAFLLILWEYFLSSSSDFLFVVPSPSSIFKNLTENYIRLFHHAFVTLKEMMGGFFLAVTASFPLAWLMHRFKSSRAILQPFFIVIQCIPMFTLAPIMVIWMGWSYTAIVIPTALMIFFPLTLNIYQGLRATPKALSEFFESNQATPLQTFYKLHLPWSIPHIFAGFRIASAIAGVGAIAGEWAGAQEGLGILMLESRRNVDLETTFAALFFLTVMSFSLYTLILGLEKLITYPRPFRHTKRALPPKIQALRKKYPAFALFLLLLLLTGCAKNENPPLRLLLDWLPNPNHVPLYVGLDQGYFKEEGINLSLQKMHETGGGIVFLTSHQADLLVGHMPSLMRHKAKGAQVKIIGVLIKEPLNCLLYRKDLGIEKPSDLNGKRLGYCVGSPDTLFLDYLLKEKAIAVSEKLNVGTDLISALGTRRIDILFGTYLNIEPAELEMLGVSCGYFKVKEFGVPNYYEFIILANSDDPKITPDFALRFQRALQKSIDYCKNKPTDAFAIYLRQNPDKREKTIQWEKVAWTATFPLLASDQSIDKEDLSRFASWVEKVWDFKQPIDHQSLTY